jgi:hypothetical protein
VNRYADITIWQLREEMKLLQAELATRDVTLRKPEPSNAGTQMRDLMAISAPEPEMVEWRHNLNIVRAVLAERGDDPLLVARLDTVLCAMLSASPAREQKDKP